MMSRLRIIFFALLLTVGLVSPASALDTRYVDVAQVTWNGASAPSVTLTDIASAIDKEVSPNWMKFTTLQGDSRDKSINFIYGTTLSTPIRLATSSVCERNDFTGFMNAIRDEVYKQLGLSDWKERYLVILTPAAGCVWSGRAAMGADNTKGGVMMLHNTASGFVITHELGHSLGLGHSNLLRCDTGASDGAWSKDCRAVEYGGSIDVMGNVDTTSPLSTYHQWRMGLLESKDVKQSWLNETIELGASDIYGGTRAIFIRDGKSTYWIEYRRATGQYNAGLVIYRTDPPSPSLVDSPNPSDSLGSEPGVGVSTDLWMLNLDSYRYSATGKTSGSMTLPMTKSTILYSGNISIQATAESSDAKISVKISRKADVTAPPVPPITPLSQWRFPGAEIIQSGYDDGESAIASFEAQVDGVQVPLASSATTNFMPTYLDPFVSRRTVYVKDLPEGNYSLALRAIDMWGNKSAWSNPVKVTIDRGVPTVGTSTQVTSIGADSLRLALNEFKDAGSGLCSTQILNDDGFVLQASTAKVAPEIQVKSKGTLSARIDTFDCLGNGVTGKLDLTSDLITAAQASRTGKWSAAPSLGNGAMTCTGKCSASFTTSGQAQVLVADGQATLYLASKVFAQVPASKVKALRVGGSVDIGPRNKVLRISGSNFTLLGVAKVNLAITGTKEVVRAPEVDDPSLSESIQKSMARYGFVGDDFANDWVVLPMSRGTTLEDPTLDLCSASYKSESGRQYRRQIMVSKVGSPYIFLSSEVVKYKDKSAGEAALAELQANFSACVKNKGGIESDGTFVDYTFYPLPSSPAQLVPDSSRVLVRAQIGKGVTARQLLGFYQFNGEMFTGLYVVKAGEVPYSEKEVLRWFDVASVLAKRLGTKF